MCDIWSESPSSIEISEGCNAENMTKAIAVLLRNDQNKNPIEKIVGFTENGASPNARPM